MRYLLLVGFCLVTSTALAEAPEDKLDAILKELRALSQRVDLLEARLRVIEKQVERGSRQLEPPTRLFPDRYRNPFKPGIQPQDVLRMQIEEPGSLLKNIHEQERTLRNRRFPPDTF